MDKQRFLVRLTAKVESIENEEVRIKTNFAACRELLETSVQENSTDAQLLETLTQLIAFIGDLDVLRTIAAFKKAEVVAQLVQKYSKQEVSDLTTLPAAYINKLLRF